MKPGQSNSSRAWTRRSFVQTVTSLSALGGFASLPPVAAASSILGSDSGASSKPSPRFAYVAAAQSIHVFRIAPNGSWQRTQIVSTPSPSALLLSPNQSHLYVTNAVDSFEDRPTGSVHAFTVDTSTGLLTHLNRQGLALAATRPSHLAISPDGRRLAVTSAGATSCNLLPIQPDGSVGRVTASLKQIGSSLHPDHARPQAVHFYTDASILAVDATTDRISSFAVVDGEALALNAHHPTTPGSSPSHITAQPGSSLLFVAGGLDPTITSLRLQPNEPTLLLDLYRLSLPARASAISALAIHPSQSLLFACDATSIWTARVNDSGVLTVANELQHGLKRPASLVVSQDGRYLIATDRSRGALLQFRIDPQQASLAPPIELAHMESPVAITLKHI